MSTTKTLLEKTMDFLRSRQMSYRITFSLESKPATDVLSDLAKFCRANETTFHTDARAHAILEGRREVWLRIQNHLNLSTEDLYKLLNK